MSFSVRAGEENESATPSAMSLSQSRHSTPSGYRVSPHLVPLTASAPPLTASAINHQQLLAATYGQAFPELSSLYKRPATDPSKYKTTICRNWSSRGACTFRGCTFAHGIDDLRLPIRSNAAVLQLGNSPHHPHSGSGSGSAGGGGGTASPGHSSSGSGSATGKTGSGIGTAAGGATGPHQQLHTHLSPSGRTLSWEQLVSLLLANVKCRRETMALHAAATRSMEEALQREEIEMAELSQVLNALHQQHEQLAMQINERNLLLRERAAAYPATAEKVEQLLLRFQTQQEISKQFGIVSQFPDLSSTVASTAAAAAMTTTANNTTNTTNAFSASAAPFSPSGGGLGMLAETADDVSEDTLQDMLEALKS